MTEIRLPEDAEHDAIERQEQFWAEAYDENQAVQTEDQKLVLRWGQGCSWHLIGMPAPRCYFSTNGEQPFSTRTFWLYPDIDYPIELLQRRGIGAVIMKGLNGPRDQRHCQDNLSVTHLGGGWEAYCVADGHGPDGQWSSARIVQALPYFLTQTSCAALLAAGGAEAALRHAFLLAETDLELQARHAKTKLLLSGCTVTCALWNAAHRFVWIGYVGDSRAALLDPGGELLHESVDHKASVQAEHDRVTELGCEVDTQQHPDGTEETRVFIRDKCYPGLTITRSMGDTCVKDHGVEARPEVLCWPLDDDILQNAGAPLLIVASNGLWQPLGTMRVATVVGDRVARGTSMQDTANDLLSIAKARWRELDREYCDDIAMLLVPLPGSGRENEPILDAGAFSRSAWGSSHRSRGCADQLESAQCTVT